MPVQSAIPAATHYPRPSLSHALAAIGATLRVWRHRARARIDLANMDELERHDLPFARDVDIPGEIAKPFWRG